MRQPNKLILVVIFGIVLGIPLNASALKLKLVPQGHQWILLPNRTLVVDVVTDDPTGISGAVMSISYPKEALSLDQPPVSTDYFEEGGWQTHTDTPGLVMFAGLNLDSGLQNTGKPRYTRLFSVRFRVNSTANTGIYRITLTESSLCSGPAGWGHDANNNGVYDPGDTYEKAPILYTLRHEPESDPDVVTDVLMESFARDPRLVFKLINKGDGNIYFSRSISPEDMTGLSAGIPDEGYDTRNQEAGDLTASIILKDPSHNQNAVSLAPGLEIEYTPGLNAAALIQMTWQISRDNTFDDLVFQSTTPRSMATLQMPELVCEPLSTYFWRVTGMDENGQPVASSSVAMFTTGSSDAADLNANGIADNQEVSPQNNAILKVFPDAGGSGLKVLQSEDAGCRFGLLCEEDTADIVGVKWMDSKDMLSSNAEEAVYPSGLLAFRVSTRNSEGSATIQVYYSNPIHPRSAWRAYDPSTGGYDEADYAAVSRDRQSVVLRLIDGGTGDADGVANGIIVNVGGLSLDK